MKRIIIIAMLVLLIANSAHASVAIGPAKVEIIDLLWWLRGSGLDLWPFNDWEDGGFWNGGGDAAGGGSSEAG